ncbi:DUF302 domain-containing protein [bacterium]|nr:DUF302 domain-containing protein [bacterium]
MPSMMLTVHESPYSIDETCTRLTESIEANGWSSPAVRNMNNAMSKEGVQMESPVRIVELCKAEYAREVLQSNPEVATLMPCAFAVYENQGKVYVSGMNTGLMGKMFGGTIAEVMGGRVSADEARILSCLE